ncbi:MAG: hypothetical protein AAF479_15105, partial [Pseudomonadota bacterium]
MARLTDMELAKAFVPKTARSFADVASILEAREDLRPERRRDMISGLQRVADAIGWPVAECPADPVWLQPKLIKVKPAALGISKKTWTNTVSNAKSALAAIGILARDRGSPRELLPPWRSLWD